VLFLSCDMPFVPAAGLRRLIAALRTRDRGVFYARDDGFVGFPLLLRSGALEIVGAQIQVEELSLQSLAGILRARTLPLPRSEAWRNLNTPAELAVARAAFQGSKPRRVIDRA
jgi:molybdopterin-guanine dinucleotide biosynthesis protein A